MTKNEIEQVRQLYAESDDEEKKEEVNKEQVVKDKNNHLLFAKHPNKYKKGDWDVRKGRRKKTKSREINKEEINQENDEENEQEENRREQDIVNWLNEICSASKLMINGKILRIENLSRDLKDGLFLLYFLDLMHPNIVDWTQCQQKQPLSRQQCLSNCHYIISLIKKEPFSSSFFNIESIPSDGTNIYNANKDILYRILLNLINYHYISILSQLLQHKATEYDILHWTNNELKKKLKYPRFCSFEEKKLHQFDDKTLKSCLYYIDLLLILMDDPRNDINRDIVITQNNRQFPSDDYTKSECLNNARYALSIARKFGAIFYISPYDLVNVKCPEVTMSFVMVIMVLILTKNEIVYILVL